MSEALQLPAALLDRAALPYRSAGLHPWLFARGKLKGDPVFASLLRLGLIPPHSRLLDLGCGQGLLAALLCAAATADCGWPAGWAEPPRGVAVRGIEQMARDVRWANHMAERDSDDVAPTRFEQGDIRTAEFGHADRVVLLDVLHYLAFDEQQRVLARVRDCLTPDGMLLLRVADANAGSGFALGLLVDKLVLAARGSRRLGLYCRPLEEWRELLRKIGFSVQTLPMHSGTPFANLLLVGRLG